MVGVCRERKDSTGKWEVNILVELVKEEVDQDEFLVSVPPLLRFSGNHEYCF